MVQMGCMVTARSLTGSSMLVSWLSLDRSVIDRSEGVSLALTWPGFKNGRVRSFDSSMKIPLRNFSDWARI